MFLRIPTQGRDDIEYGDTCFFYSITISKTFSSYQEIGKLRLQKYIVITKKKMAIVIQVGNSTETKSGQSFQLSEVTNKSTLLQKYIHAMQMNLRSIVTLVHTYGYRL